MGSCLHNHFRERSVQRIAYSPPSPRSRLVKNVADSKLVKDLTEPYRIIRKLIMRRRFSIGALRTIGDSLRYVLDCARHVSFSSSVFN